MKKDFCEHKLKQLKRDYSFLEFLSTMEDTNLWLLQQENKIKLVKEKLQKTTLEEERLKQQLHQLHRQVQIVYVYQKYLKKIANRKVVQAMRKEPIELTKKQYTILQDMIENKPFQASLEDYKKIYAYVLENDLSQMILEKILNDVYIISKDEDAKEIAFNYLKQRTSSYLQGIDNLEQRKKIKQKFQILYEPKISKEQPISYNPLYDVLCFWILDGNSYPYLKRYLEIDENACNTLSKDGVPIVFFLLQKTLESCLTELENQKKPDSYVHKEYFFSILKLFLNDKNIHLSESENFDFDQTIESFLEYISHKHYKNAPNIIKAFKELKTVEKEEEIMVPEMMSHLSSIGDFIVRKNDRHDMTDEYTIVLSNDKEYFNRAYSFTMDTNGRMIFKIHTVDSSSYIPEDTELDEYLKHQMFQRNGFLPKSIALDSMSLKPGIKRPCLTYEITLDGNGKVTSHDIYESYIQVDEVKTYQQLDIDTIRKDEKLYPMAYVFYALCNDSFKEYTKEDFKTEFEKMLLSVTSRVVGRYFEKREYPFIYRVQAPQDSEKFCYQVTKLNYLMGKMKREDAKKVYQVLCEDQNVSFYDDKNIGHADLEQEFYVDLFNPMDSYITLTLQRLIKQYYIKRQEDMYRKEQIQEIIRLANKRKNQLREKKKVLKKNEIHSF